MGLARATIPVVQIPSFQHCPTQDSHSQRTHLEESSQPAVRVRDLHDRHSVRRQTVRCRFLSSQVRPSYRRTASVLRCYIRTVSQLWLVVFPSISNNAGPCQVFFLSFHSFFLFSLHTSPFTPASGLVRFL